jgi:hypothetical protein
MIQPTATFKDNLALLPSIEGIARLDLINAEGEIVATIENQPGKQGSLAVYQYLQREFGALNGEAAQHGLEIFAEHTADAKNRPGAHPNIDRLFAIVAGGAELQIALTSAA